MIKRYITFKGRWADAPVTILRDRVVGFCGHNPQTIACSLILENGTYLYLNKFSCDEIEKQLQEFDAQMKL